jgi:hypothetical protein
MQEIFVPRNVGFGRVFQFPAGCVCYASAAPNSPSGVTFAVSRALEQIRDDWRGLENHREVGLSADSRDPDNHRVDLRGLEKRVKVTAVLVLLRGLASMILSRRATSDGYMHAWRKK